MSSNVPVDKPVIGLFSIKSISINNFKGISEAEIRNLNKINLFFGPNNAGKSTILETLRLFKLLQANQLAEIMRRRVARTNWTSKDIFWDYRTGSTASIELTSTAGKSIGLKIQSDFASGSFTVKLLSDGSEAGSQLQFQSNLNAFGSLSLEEAFGSELADHLNSVEQVDNYLRTNLGAIETSYLQKLKQEGLDIAVIDAYSRAYGQKVTSWDSLLYSGTEYRTSVRGSDYRGRFLDGLGDGARAGFLLLAIASALKETWLLVEEIENHQHPNALRGLVSELSKLVEQNHLQLFITTHNPDVFRYCAAQQNVSLQYVQRNLEGLVTSTSVASTDLKPLLDMGWDLANILDSERFILVEGTHDLQFLAHAIHKVADRWPHELGITLIPYGGTDNLATVLKALMFPVRQLHVVRDLDSDTEKTVRESIVVSIGNRFRQEGYEVNRTDEELQITKADTKQSLKLSFKNVHAAGDPTSLPNIKQHEFEDYLILILCNTKKIDSKSLKYESAKAALHDQLKSADVEKALDLIVKSTRSELPDSLVDLVKVVIG
jgi:hypothetical protein